MDVSGTATGIASTEGTVEFAAAYQGTAEAHRTWYKIVGGRQAEDNSKKRNARLPLLALHGGPGCTHDYLLSLTDLTGDGRAVIFYDQIGNGRSSHLPERGADFWTVDLFVRELRNLVGELGLDKTGYHLLGQSWGGFLAQEFALTQPAGLASIVLADTASSWQGFLDECNKLRAKLPPDVEATLRGHEAAGRTGRSGTATWRSSGAGCGATIHPPRAADNRHACRLSHAAALTGADDRH